MEKLNYDKKTLNNFAQIMFIGFGLIGTFLFLKHNQIFVWFYLTGTLFLLAKVIYIESLKPIYIIWMGLAFILGWINTRILLAIVFYLVFTPIGLLLRLCGKDFLDEKIDKKTGSYWKLKEKNEFCQKDYYRQF